MERTLHILNGQVMYHVFKSKHFLEPDSMIPFNEAMCYGETCGDLFSQEFISIRAKVHHVTETQYSEITLQPLKPFFEGDFSRINLWFDTDMFCQINLLTILAWLDQIQYQGNVEVQFVDRHFEVINHFPLSATGYKKLYDQVLIQKKKPGHIEPPPLEKGVEQYLNFLNPNSDLMMYIQEHRDVTDGKLVALLLDQFKEYGLGDNQYRDIIKSYRNKNV